MCWPQREGSQSLVINPLLEARITENQQRELILYGRAGIPYIIESSPDGDATGSWNHVKSVTVSTQLSEVIRITGSADQTIFYRARE